MRRELSEREETMPMGRLLLDIDKNGKVDSKEMEQIVTVGMKARRWCIGECSI